MCFEIYQSDNDSKYYWRLWYKKEIIATGHEGYYRRESCVHDINVVKRSGDAGYC